MEAVVDANTESVRQSLKKEWEKRKNRYQNGIAVKGKHSHVCSISAFLPFPFSINLHGQPLLKKKKLNFWGISVSFYSIIPIIPGWVKIFKDIISVIRDHMPKIFIYILDFFFLSTKNQGFSAMKHAEGLKNLSFRH